MSQEIAIKIEEIKAARENALDATDQVTRALDAVWIADDGNELISRVVEELNAANQALASARRMLRRRQAQLLREEKARIELNPNAE